MPEPNAVHPDELLSAWLDGTLEIAEQAEVEDHLARCTRCRKLALELGILSRAVRDEAVPPVPPDLAARIARQGGAAAPGTGSGPRPAGAARPWWRAPLPVTAAASLVVASLVGVLSLRRDMEPLATAPAAPAARAAETPPASADAATDKPAPAPATAPAPAMPRARRPAAAPAPPADEPRAAEAEVLAESRAEPQRTDGYAPAPAEDTAGAAPDGREAPRPQPGMAKAVPEGTVVEGTKAKATRRAPERQMLDQRPATDFSELEIAVILPRPRPAPEPRQEQGFTMAAPTVAPATWRPRDGEAAWEALAREARRLGGAAGDPLAAGSRRVVRVPREKAAALLEWLRKNGAENLPVRVEETVAADGTPGPEIVLVIDEK